MARLVIADGRIDVALSLLERVAALHGNVSVAVDDVLDVNAVAKPLREVRGWRAPGTAAPGIGALGTWRYRGGKDFVALRRFRQPAVIVTLRPGRGFRRLVVGTPDAEHVAATIRAQLPP
ncbi:MULTISPECIES: hypothetical protein [unclassified Parafrankia]|uniref:hypothetical protein n=1 Tax=unclassified Parafrankia TaxID=2994368 RepID=UPI000DA4C5EE|nr:MULTISPECIES: hypothetical protein [unclassified Parafrankia]TCJ30673.1 hypothetical protein E0504_49780 [Parafrankia sp. BMG5.11]SQD97454.1 conserved hypothetical protein [Parafrankia sp. Ea1.12]